ncbi:MAG: hypothetical protein EDR02_14425 [Actinobacteria bacterium]|nr:MAG: hypothetical protein EDR02_14425 [Actinomycetota bacterium]RIK06311.1 MAG: hypothetical protein DCC48_07755 [Acidobacteriota bacterium]
MRDLPPGWEWTTIGEVASVQLGRQRSPKNHSGSHMRPYLRSANVTWDGIDLADVKEMNFEPDEAERFELKPGDLLLNEASGSPNEVGKPAIWGGEIEGCCFQNTLLRVRPQGVSTAYLYWYCRASALGGQFGEAGRGVNIRHLGKQGLASFRCPLPPLGEQERIAAAIEEHVSILYAAEASAEAARVRVEPLRERAVGSRFREGWQRIDLVDTLERLSDCPHRTPGYSPDGAHLALRPRDVVGGRLETAHTARVNEAEYSQQIARDKPRAGDVVYSRELSYGWAAVVPDGLSLCLSQGMVLMRPATVRAELLAAFLNSAEGRSQAHRAATGSAHPHINLRDIKRYRVPQVPEQDQDELLGDIERIEEACERLTDSLEFVLRRTRALHRSVLAAAFCGQLVPQDPNDELASVLLDRIRRENDARATAQTKRTRKARAS